MDDPPGSARPKKALTKFRFERLVGRYLANPAVAALDRMGIRPPMIAELETTGRRSAIPRRVPVAVTVDADGAWLIAQHGRRSGWGHNIDADPRVRLGLRDGWRTGTAVFVDADDVTARAESFARRPAARRAARTAFRALQSTPISVRVTFDRP
ncbi:MAG: nitroreductase/quinone reductase family protein [Pseudonocardia sp.]|jgi:deazaflavin-dependent oxidoreductase (nitroreductase family)